MSKRNTPVVDISESQHCTVQSANVTRGHRCLHHHTKNISLCFSGSLWETLVLHAKGKTEKKP